MILTSTVMSCKRNIGTPMNNKWKQIEKYAAHDGPIYILARESQETLPSTADGR